VFLFKHLEIFDKIKIIRSYEVGLSNFLIQNGFKAKAYIPSTDLNSLFHIDAKNNPTCYHPLKLIKKGMPFIKVDLLRKNPVGARLDPIYKILEKMNYDLSLIEFDRPINHKGSFKRLIFRKIRGIF
jgi:lipopolysaccharide biosynthesis protein|tara:strand:+ start:140 stop:520 length:381 start_codon:yes stop_codon:yes gene_type:complete